MLKIRMETKIKLLISRTMAAKVLQTKDTEQVFCNKIKHLADDGKIISLDKVKAELYKGDNLHDGAK